MTGRFAPRDAILSGGSRVLSFGLAQISRRWAAAAAGLLGATLLAVFAHAHGYSPFCQCSGLGFGVQSGVPGQRCLAVDRDARAGPGEAGYNVVLAADCANRPARVITHTSYLGADAQGATFEFPLVGAVERLCLQIDFDTSAGAEQQTRNVIAWPSCNQGPNQVWRRVYVSDFSAFGYFAEIDGQAWCLEVAPAGAEGAGGFNIVARAGCQLRENQQWSHVRLGRRRDRS